MRGAQSLRHGRAGAVARRLARDLGQAVPVAVGVVVITFLLVRLAPGDPALAILGTRATPEALAALRAELELDRPLTQQFTSYAGGLLTGDLGESIVQSGRPVATIIWESLGITAALISMAIVLALALGVPLGLWSATARRAGLDVVIRAAATVALAVPPFFLGLVLLLVVALSWDLLPAGGWGGGWPQNLTYSVLPVIPLSLFLAAQILRTVRQSAIDVLGQQFIEAAIARGVPERTIVLRHVLPNCMAPVITLVGLNFGALIAGAVVIEAVFAIPGLGTELVQAVASRDYPIIQGIALVTAVLVVVANLVADAIQAVVDPRVAD